MMNDILEKLDNIIKDRLNNPKKDSYTSAMFAKGENTIIKKMGEEFAELVKALSQNNRDEIIYESVDFIYHMMIGLRYNDISVKEVIKELDRRNRSYT